ncbi:MAG TPA: nuclear transport factor 2 family protein [Blastocatellia bacterium]|nr:nuclear transport factor 2 family protein [Blastocatellia bacterium]
MFRTREQMVVCVAAGFASMFVLSLLAFAQTAGVRKELEAAYAKRDKAFLNKDFGFLKSQETSDYSEKTKDGTVRNREEADAVADQMAPMVKEVAEIATKIESVKPGDQPGEYLLETSDHGKMTVNGPDGASHELTGTGRYREIWVRTKDGWKIKYHEEVESDMRIDGQPMN